MLWKAMFGAGCFWTAEWAFRQFPGVLDTAVGYSGGDVTSPTHEDVSSRDTGHAQVVMVVYDPQILDYDSVLNIFWSIHDPTQADGQAQNIGPQFRSVIFALSGEQYRKACDSKARLETEGRFTHPITTEIVRATHFWRAEEIHQRYFEKRGTRST